MQSEGADRPMLSSGTFNVNIHHFWRVVSVIEQRSSKAAFVQPGIYVAMTVGLLLGSILLHNSLRFTELNDVMTTSQPLLLPIFIATTVFSIYVALRVAIEVTRERANRTLEVLFYGPVSGNMFLFGHFIGGLKIYALGVLIIFVWMNVVMWLLNVAFDPLLVVVFLGSVLSTAAMIAFGLFVGVLGGRSRNTLILYIGTILLLLFIQAADVIVHDVIPAPAGATRTDPFITLRTALSTITAFIGWVSPFTQLQNMANALLDARPAQAVIHIGAVVTLMILLLISSSALLRQGRVRS